MRLAAIVPATNEPETLPACVAAIRAAADPPEELIVVRHPPGAGPAAARNAGAREASADVLVFVDADVEVHPDAFTRVRRALREDPELVAVFGSYDDHPSAPGVVSAFRNLLHHHVHTSSPGPATTFWAGLGAIRRDAFIVACGFDEERFRTPSIEDIELGMRLTAAGARIRLDPELRGTHAKAWTLHEMLRTDLLRRGVPWVRILLERRSGGTALNLGWRHRASAVVSIVALVALVKRRPGAFGGSVATLVLLNRSFYALLARRRGPREAALGVGLHAVHHLTAVAAVPAGAFAHLLELRKRGRRARG
jgi:Glycosyl transferase family 2